jgi:hypothetical protein
MAFNAFEITEKYVANNDLNAGKPFWDGLKKEITAHCEHISQDELRRMARIRPRKPEPAF